jgi:hypothetical protein
MPKERVEQVVKAENGLFEHVTVEVGERGVTKTAQYDRPTYEHFVDYINGLSDKAETDGEESPRQEAYRLFIASLDRRARAAVYQSLAAESTFITVGKERIDVMTFPVAKLVKTINGMRASRDMRLMAIGVDESTPAAQREAAEATVDKSIGFGPWRTAAKKLVEDGKARENVESGLLEVASAA